MPRGNQQKI